LGFDASGDLITIAGTAGAVTVSSFMETLLDDNDIETALGTLGLSKGADAASAGTLALGDGRYFNVTGAIPILAIGTKFIGAISILHFTGSLVFTHDATDLINIGGADITTEAGDHAVMFEYDTGKSVMIGYTRASSLPILPADDTTFTGDNTFSGNNIFSEPIIAPGGIQTDGTHILITKVIPIGSWDMNTDLSHNITHGVTDFKKIRSITGVIRSDDNVNGAPVGIGNVNGVLQSSFGGFPSSTEIQMLRIAGGVYDAVAYGLEEYTLDNAAAVDKGSGLVGIPITAHTFLDEDVTTIVSTTNYNGTHSIVSQTANEIVITASYVAETFAGTETASWSRGWITVVYDV
jgi:hypothetical protein